MVRADVDGPDVTRMPCAPSWLLPDGVVQPGLELRSPDGASTLGFRAESDRLALRLDDVVRWSPETAGGGSQLQMQIDGNLVASEGGRAVWSSGTDGFGGAIVRLANGGDLAVTHRGHPIWTPQDGPRCDRLHPGDFLVAGGFLRSPDRKSHMSLQESDGNLVIYGDDGPRWWSGPTIPGAVLVLHRTGALAIHAEGRVMWSTETAGFDLAMAFLTNDGDLEIKRGRRTIWSASRGYLGDILHPGEWLEVGEASYARARGFTLKVEAGGVTVRDAAGTRCDVVSGSAGTSRLTMQADGNLVIASGDRVTHHTGTMGHDGGSLVVQDDGNIVIEHDARPIWDWRTCVFERVGL